jgi:lipoprotein-anchoring transpeptidase ErfK/SrfK
MSSLSVSRVVAASFVGGALLAFVTLVPWSRGALSSSTSAGVSSIPDYSALLPDASLTVAARQHVETRFEQRAVRYLGEAPRKVTEWAVAEEEARQRAAEEAHRRAEEAYARELAAARPPEGVAFAPDERWVAVNLTTQRTIAFVGAEAVRVALVSTGAPGWETPTGDFRIFMRVENETMDSVTIGIPRDDPWGYYLEDVYFTQYFVGGVALHYNYWRADSYFGNEPSSHGCVGMRYDDANFFWDFATTGTRVVVHY